MSEILALLAVHVFFPNGVLKRVLGNMPISYCGTTGYNFYPILGCITLLRVGYCNAIFFQNEKFCGRVILLIHRVRKCIVHIELYGVLSVIGEAIKGNMPICGGGGCWTGDGGLTVKAHHPKAREKEWSRVTPRARVLGMICGRQFCPGIFIFSGS